MATLSVNTIIQSWKKFNLSELQKELDGTANEIAEQQDKSDPSRKKLVEMSREFKKNTSEDVRKLVAPLLRNFQLEVDSLYKRSKSAEVAFLAIYKKILDLSDPSPALDHYISVQQKVSRLADVEIEAKQLRETLKDYNQEFKEVKNQEVTIKQLREKIRGFEESLNKQVSLEAKQIEKDLTLQYATKENHLSQTVEDLQKKLHDAEQRAASFKNALTSTQSELFELKSTEDESVRAKSDEMEILINDLESANQRAAMAEKELAKRKEECSLLKQTQPKHPKVEDQNESSSHIISPSYEIELCTKEKEISQLVIDLQQLQETMQKEKESNYINLTELQSKVNEQEELVKCLRSTLKSQGDYSEIKEELKIFKMVEFSTGSGANSITNELPKPLEVLLLEKNKSLKSENTMLRLVNEESNLKNNEISKDYLIACNKIQEQQCLISQLEKDVSNIQSCSLYRGEGEGQAAPPLASELVAEAVKEAVPASPQDHGNIAESLLPIVTSQRERFRQHNEELESHNSSQQQHITMLQGELEQLRSDNVKLYGKIKFLQGFPSQRSSAYDDMENRYSSQYEAKLDPFSSFSRNEKQRKYMNLSPFEKITLGMGRAILSNKVARTFAFIYTLLVHCMIFLVLYKLAHTESCKRDFAYECHDRFAKHMKEVHGEALEHVLNPHG